MSDGEEEVRSGTAAMLIFGDVDCGREKRDASGDAPHAMEDQ
jgi:hypothetical protein